MAQTVNLQADQQPPLVTIAAVPSVRVTIQQLDSRGSKQRGRNAIIGGKLGFQEWSVAANPDATGLMTVLAPRGLRDAYCYSIVSDQEFVHYRLQPDAPLQVGKDVKLGQLDQDRSGIELVRSLAPMLVIMVADPTGQAVPNPHLTVDYAEAEAERPGRFPSHRPAPAGLLKERRQSDGRFRIVGLEPNRRVAVSVEATGFTSQTGFFRLSEGQVEEVALILPLLEATGVRISPTPGP